MGERPILRKNRGPAQAIAPDQPTGGEDLTYLIVKIDVHRVLLGYSRWADLAPLCNDDDPKTLDRDGLVQLLVKLRADLNQQVATRPR